MSDQLLRITLSLSLVLGAIAAVAWLVQWLRQRIQPRQRGSAIKVQAATAVGTRERVILIQVADQWVLIGVTPGHITHLLTLPEPPADAASTQTANTVPAPASWLHTYLNAQKRHDA